MRDSNSRRLASQPPTLPLDATASRPCIGGARQPPPCLGEAFTHPCLPRLSWRGGGDGPFSLDSTARRTRRHESPRAFNLRSLVWERIPSSPTPHLFSRSTRLDLAHPPPPLPWLVVALAAEWLQRGGHAAAASASPLKVLALKGRAELTEGLGIEEACGFEEACGIAKRGGIEVCGIEEAC